MDIYLILDLLVVLGLFGLASTTLIKSTRDRLHQVFAAFVLSIGVWIVANYISNDIALSPQVATRANYFVFAFSYLAAIFLVLFVTLLTGKRRTAPKWFKYYLRMSWIIAVVSATPLVVKGVEKQDNLYAVIFGPAAAVYFVTLIVDIVMAFVIVHRNLKHSTGQDKDRLRVLLRSLYLTFPVLILAQAVIPALTGWFGLTNLGVLPMLILVFGLYYGTVKYKLFDLRLIVVRSLAYILTLLTIAGLYSLVVFVVFASIVSGGKLSTTQEGIYALSAIVFGFSLPSLKRFFDKLTNRLFYRDAYDAQDLLDKFNKILVGNIDLDTILKQSADIISNTVKAEFAAFLIRETEGTSRRASYSKIVQLNTEHILALKGKTKGKTELYVADEIEDEHDKYKQVFSENNIAIAARLAGSGDIGEQGFLLLGPKQSGNPYNKQDLQVLDIISNELVIAIQNALRFEEIETFNITLQQKVNDATKQLRQTNEKLKALDETKDEFISMASHQLRTPLTAVKGYVSMVVEGDAGKLNKQQKELLDQAFASSQRMVYLIADLLNVSRLRSGKFIIENKPTQLADVVESEMEQLTDMANSKQQTLTYVKPANFPALNMDETKIRQVIMNFADNALHYTPNGGHIQIHLEDKGDTIQYTVVDDGLGVPKAEQHHLFTKFYRAGNAKKARPDGTGLGLFMAKKVVAAQGGSIIFNSEENKGSTFGFIFPKAKMLVKETAKLADSKKVEKDVTPKTKA